jgi:hypothetical protein
MITEKTTELGIPQRSFTDEEILRRLLFASINETCKILEEAKAYRASDIDVMWLNGFDFPRHRGGLMYWADTIGVAEVYRQIQAWHQQYGEHWAPTPSSAVSPKPAPTARSQTQPPDITQHPSPGGLGASEFPLRCHTAARCCLCGLF